MNEAQHIKESVHEESVHEASLQRFSRLPWHFVIMFMINNETHYQTVNKNLH